MAYYVLGSGGAKFGPVDIGTINAWIGQGRVEPGTLIEDAGSGVKSPARAIRGLQFAGTDQSIATPMNPLPGPPHANLFAGSTPHQPPPMPTLQSNYLRPGMGTGGSQRNLFLPGADSKWAWHGFACVGAALVCAVFIAITHMYIGWYVSKILLFAFALPIFGVQRGYRGLQYNRPLAIVVITLNILAMLGAVAIVFKDIFI